MVPPIASHGPRSDYSNRLARFLPRGIRARLFALITLALLPLILLLVWISYQRYETRRIQSMQTEAEVARGVATTFAAYIQGVHQQNYAVGQFIINDDSLNDNDMTRALRTTATHFPAIRSLHWVSPAGTVMLSSEPEAVGMDLSNRAYFKAVAAGEPLVVDNLNPNGAISKSATLVVATGVRDTNNRLRGLVIAAIDPNRLNELVLTQQRPTKGAFSIFDRQGVLVFDSARTQPTWEERISWLHGDALLQRALQTGQEQSNITSLPAGGEWVTARAPVEGIGFIAGAHRPASVAFASLENSLMQDMLIALSVGALAFLFSSILAQTIARPLYRLEQDAFEMGAGRIQPHTDDPQAPVEVVHLRGTIENMATGLIQRAEALRESEERFRVLFNNRHSPMLLIDPDTSQIVEANPAACSYYGWSHEALTHKKITDLNTLPPDQVQQEINRAQKSSANTEFFFRHRLANDDIRDVEVHSGPIEIAGKEYLFSIIQDITERRLAEARAEEGKYILDVLMAYVPEGITIADAPDYTIRMVSRYGQEKLGAAHDGMRAEAVAEQWRVYHSDGITPLADEDLPLVRAIQKGETIKDVEVVQVNARGQHLSLLCNAAPIRSSDGEITGGVVAWRDITERKQVEEALRKSEMQLRTIVDNLTEGLIVSDMEGNVLDWNRAALKMHEISHVEDARLKLAEFGSIYALGPLEGDPWPVDHWPLARVLRGETIRDLEVRIRRLSDGWERIFSYGGTLVHDGSGQPVMALITVDDITERKQAEAALREAHDRAVWMARFPDENPSPVMRVSADRTVMYVNQAAQAAEWACEVGQPLPDLFWELVKDGVHQPMGQRQEKQVDIQLANRYYTISIMAFPNEGYVNIYGRDITTRKQADEALKASEARLRRLVDGNIIGVVTRDVAGRVKDGNDAFLNMLGYTCQDVMAGNLHTSNLIPEEYQPLEAQLVQEVLATGLSQTYEKEYYHKDGRRIPILVGYTRLEGSSDDLIGFVLDLTELKKAQGELAEYADKLKRSNQELEQFAFVASHDLQEPLRKVKLFGGSLQKQLGEGVSADARDYLSRMLNAADRMQSMIDSLLDLSRVNTRGGNFELTNLTSIAEDAVSNLEARIYSSQGQVIVEELPTAEVDILQMRQLLQNLIANALKFHQPDVPPVVRVSAAQLRYTRIPQIQIIVEDNGIGFDPQYTERIFQPFQRLHGRSEYEGTGMGLAICQKIVERHHGTIQARSHPGEGATFTVTLPVRQID